MQVKSFHTSGVIYVSCASCFTLDISFQVSFIRWLLVALLKSSAEKYY